MWKIIHSSKWELVYFVYDFSICILHYTNNWAGDIRKGVSRRITWYSLTFGLSEILVDFLGIFDTKSTLDAKVWLNSTLKGKMQSMSSNNHFGITTNVVWYLEFCLYTFLAIFVMPYSSTSMTDPLKYLCHFQFPNVVCNTGLIPISL